MRKFHGLPLLNGLKNAGAAVLLLTLLVALQLAALAATTLTACWLLKFIA